MYFHCIIIPYLPEFMLHSSSGMKDEQLRESHTSYKIVKSASQPVTCSEISIKHIEEAITLSARWEISPGTHIHFFCSTNMVQVHWPESGISFKTWLLMELHLLIGFDIYVVLKIYSTWLSYTWLDVELIILLYMWWKIIDVEFHLRKQNTQGAYKGGITLEEIILEAPRTAMLE